MNPNTRGIWYSFFGDTGTVDVVITDAPFDVKLVAFSGECDSQACVGNNDGEGFTASLSIPTVAGTKCKLVGGKLSHAESRE